MMSKLFANVRVGLLFCIATFGLNLSNAFSQGPDCGSGITALQIGQCTTFTNNTDGIPVGQNANCGTGTAYSDVWYRVVGTGEQLQLYVQSNHNTSISLFTSCPTSSAASGSTALQCASGTSSTLIPLSWSTAVGQTYYIRIQRRSGSNQSDQSGTICLYNNQSNLINCSSATALTVGTTCNTTNFTNNEDGSFLWNRDCTDGDGVYSSVWFTFQGTGNPVSANLFNLTEEAMIAIYPSCPTAADANTLAIACADIDDAVGSVNFNTTANQTYYAQIMRTGGDNNDNQSGSICLFNYELSACGNPTGLLNDFCENPATLFQNPSYTFSATTGGTFTPDLNSEARAAATTGATGACNTQMRMDNNSWYQFTAEATSQTFPFTYTACQGVQGVVFEVNYATNGCCTSFIRKSNCIFNAPVINSTPSQSPANTLTATGLTIGKKYMLMIDGYNGASCSFTISGWGAVNVLPVEMSLFTVIQFDDKNEIIWKTESEKNNAYFEVWRSYDGENFEFLQTIEGAGTSSTANFYQYSDHEIRFGDVYYKLKQVDLDGKTFESNWIYTSRTSSTEGMISVHPNPARDKATIDLNVRHNSGGTLMIYGVNGQQVYTQFIDQVGVHQVYVPVNSFEKGVYIVRYQDQANSMIKHLVVE